MENGGEDGNFIIFQECPYLQIEEPCLSSPPCLHRRRRALPTAIVCATSSHRRRRYVPPLLPSFLITAAPPSLCMYFLLLMICLLRHKFPFLQLMYSHWQDSCFLMEIRIFFMCSKFWRFIFAPIYILSIKCNDISFTLQLRSPCFHMQSLFSHALSIIIFLFFVENHALPL